MIADEDMVITVSRGGYIKRSPLSLYRAQRRGGKGRIGMQTKEEDIVEHLFVASRALRTSSSSPTADGCTGSRCTRSPRSRRTRAARRSSTC